MSPLRAQAAAENSLGTGTDSQCWRKLSPIVVCRISLRSVDNFSRIPVGVVSEVHAHYLCRIYSTNEKH